MRVLRLYALACSCLVILLAFAMLWKGGKSLETTWFLVGAAWLFMVVQWRQSLRASDPAATERTDVPDAVWLLTIGFALWTGLSFLTSATQNYGLDEVLRDGSLALLFLSAVGWLRVDSLWRKRLLSALAMMACVAVAVGILVYVLQPVNRFVGTFFDHRFSTDYWPNAWAQFTLLAWPLVLWWTLQARQRPERMLRFSFLGILIGGLFLSYSRAALLVFLGQIVLGGCFLLCARYRERGASPWEALRPFLRRGAAVLLVALCTFLVVNELRGRSFAVESVARKITFTAAEGRSSVSERTQFWKQALLLSADHPFLGSGPYSFRFLQPRLQEGVFATSDHPHNVFLKLAMERGWPAAILFAFLLGLLLLRACALALHGTSPHAQSAALLLLAATGVLAHNLLDYNLQFVGIALPFWLLLAFLEALQSGTRAGRITLRLRKGIEVALLSVLLIVAIIEGRFLVLSSLGRRAQAAGNTERALAWYESARGEVFSRDLNLSRASLLMGRQEWKAAAKALTEYLRQNGEDARAWKMQGDLLRIQDDLPAALLAYDQADLRGRYNDLGILEGRLLVLKDLGDEEALERQRSEVFTILQRFAEAMEANTHFIALSDNVEIFLRTARSAAILYPDREAALHIIAAGVDRHAREERATYTARKPGRLW